VRRIRRTAAAVALTAVVAGVLTLGASAAAPNALTGPVSAVGGSTATLTGTVNPGGAATDWWFEYGTSTSYGSKTATNAAGSGTANAAVNAPLTGLSPSTTYHYRLVAKNASGTSNGADGVFTTASPPAVVTTAATGVSPNSATLGGTVNPNGQATSWYVEYGTSTSYGSRSASTSAGAGTVAKAVSVTVNGLTGGRTYHFRLVATSSVGTTTGADVTFATGELPGATTAPATSIGASTVRLNGSVDPNGRATTYFFEYGTSTAYGSKTSTSSAGSGSNAVAVAKSVNGLKPGTTYHFRVVATSNVGTVGGADRTFTTLSPPAVTTGVADSIGPTTARLGGVVNPNGRSTTWYFEFGPTTAYGQRSPSISAGSGSAPLGVFAYISQLSPGVTYHFRIVATNAIGTTRGGDATFATSGPPAVATGAVAFTTLSLTSTQVSGVVNPRGTETTWWFEYGRTRNYGKRTASVSATGTADVQATVLLRGLQPGVRWHYRLVAQSSVGTSVGTDASFSTPPRPLDPEGRPVRCTIVGTQAADVLRGTSSADVICGLGGNDTIVGRGGNDVVYGGPGADTISGGLGRDTLRGGSGNDTFNAREGRRDVIVGGFGRDLAIFDTRLDRLTSVERRRAS